MLFRLLRPFAFPCSDKLTGTDWAIKFSIILGVPILAYLLFQYLSHDPMLPWFWFGAVLQRGEEIRWNQGATLGFPLI